MSESVRTISTREKKITKRCPKCGETKLLNEFHKHEGCKYGVAVYCKECRRITRLTRIAHSKDPAADKGIIKVRNAKWKAAHKETVKGYNAKWRAENKWWMDNWRMRNKDKITADYARRRARESNADGDATAEQIAGRWEMYGWRCYICGVPAEATDHVIPLAVGGSNWPANLRPICKSCNSRKGAEWPYSPVTTNAIVSSNNKKCPSRSLWRVR